MATTRVRFFDNSDAVSVLEVETSNRPDLASAIALALVELRVQVVNFETRVSGRAARGKLSIAELDGARIEGARRLQIQDHVLAAIGQQTLAAT